MYEIAGNMLKALRDLNSDFNHRPNGAALRRDYTRNQFNGDTPPMFMPRHDIAKSCFDYLHVVCSGSCCVDY